MPTYEYRCPEGHEFELFQRMSDEPKASCPTCGAEASRLLSSGAGFLFKGEGFYITDTRSKDYREAAKSEGKDSVMKADKTAHDSKPSAQSEAKPGTPKEGAVASPAPGVSASKKKGASSSDPS